MLPNVAWMWHQRDTSLLLAAQQCGPRFGFTARDKTDQHWNEGSFTPVCSPKMCNSYIPKVLGCRASTKKSKHILNIFLFRLKVQTWIYCSSAESLCRFVQHTWSSQVQPAFGECIKKTVLMEHFGVQLRFSDSKGPRLSVDHTHQGDCSFSQPILLDYTPVMYRIKNVSSIFTCKVENCLFATRMYGDIPSHI